MPRHPLSHLPHPALTKSLVVASLLFFLFSGHVPPTLVESPGKSNARPRRDVFFLPFLTQHEKIGIFLRHGVHWTGGGVVVEGSLL